MKKLVSFEGRFLLNETNFCLCNITSLGKDTNVVKNNKLKGDVLSWEDEEA